MIHNIKSLKSQIESAPEKKQIEIFHILRLQGIDVVYSDSTDDVRFNLAQCSPQCLNQIANVFNNPSTSSSTH